MNRRAIPILCLMFVCSCASPPTPRPPGSVRGERLLRQGLEAAARGDAPLALELFTAASRWYDSVGDREGGSVARIDAARLLRRGGRVADAERLLHEVGRLPPSAPRTLGELALEQALVAERKGDHATALSIARETALHPDPSVALTAANVAARLLLDQGRVDEAGETLSRQGSTSCRGCEGEMGRNRLLSARVSRLLGDRDPLPLLQEGIDLLRQGGDAEGLVDALELFAAIHDARGDADAASRAREEAKRINSARTALSTTDAFR